MGNDRLANWSNSSRRTIKNSNNSIIRCLVNAVDSKSSISIIYYGGTNPGCKRTIRPKEVYSVSGYQSSYVRAFCELRKEELTFSISKLHLTDTIQQSGLKSLKSSASSTVLSQSYEGGNKYAMEHIREAVEFAREVGGTDQDVKDYFFNLDTDTLSRILNIYGKLYGSEKMYYAKNTFQNWKTGQTYMSGLVAKRLFGLIPQHMPTKDRFKLVETLWKTHKPKKKAWCCYGLFSDSQNIGAILKEFFDENARGHDIPSNFKHRFKWLSDGDTSTYERLLNHYLELDRERAALAVQKTSEIIKEHCSETRASTVIQKSSHIVEVDGYAVEVIFDRDVTDISITKYDPRIRPKIKPKSQLRTTLKSRSKTVFESSESKNSYEDNNWSNEELSNVVYGVCILIIMGIAAAYAIYRAITSS